MSKRKKVRAIFCHDLPVYKDINGDYCSTTLTDEVFARSLDVADELIAAVRVYQIDKTYQEAHQEKISLSHIRFLDIPNMNTVKGFFTVIPRIKKTLLKAVACSDLVFIRGGVLALLAVDAARKLNKAYVLECAGEVFINYWLHSTLGKIAAPYMEYRVRRDVWNASFVLYVTKEYLQKKYPSRGAACAVSDVVIAQTDEGILNRRIEKIRNKKRGAFVIGTTAHLATKNKGQQDVLRAMDMLRDKMDIRYELAGGGDESYLKSQVQKYHLTDRVTFMGQLRHEEVLSWIDGIDLYIQPSFSEGLSRALVEAMSRGCPAIASDIAGNRELLEKKMLFPAGNAGALCKRLVENLHGSLEEQAEKNFYKAKEYEAEKLDKKRREFFERYRDCVIGGR